MILGTTPTFVLKLKRSYDIDLRTAINLIVTFKQGTYILNKSGNDLNFEDGKTVLVSLTEEESLNLVLDKKVEIQMNWLYIDNTITKRAATKVISIDIEKQLLKESLIDEPFEPN